MNEETLYLNAKDAYTAISEKYGIEFTDNKLTTLRNNNKIDAYKNKSGRWMYDIDSAQGALFLKYPEHNIKVKKAFEIYASKKADIKNIVTDDIFKEAYKIRYPMTIGGSINSLSGKGIVANLCQNKDIIEQVAIIKLGGTPNHSTVGQDGHFIINYVKHYLEHKDIQIQTNKGSFTFSRGSLANLKKMEDLPAFINASITQKGVCVIEFIMGSTNDERFLKEYKRQLDAIDSKIKENIKKGINKKVSDTINIPAKMMADRLIITYVNPLIEEYIKNDLAYKLPDYLIESPEFSEYVLNLDENNRRTFDLNRLLDF